MLWYHKLYVVNVLQLIKMVGIKDTFGESGTPDELMEKYKLTSEAIIEEVKAILK